ncbi:MAG: radical SAM protein, partial [Marinilabiliales bacterium]|nr:radical SAM protein [Marinilabiliales bacterium]
MIPSKHNIVSKIDGTDQYFVVNLLSGQADLLDSEDATLLLTEGTAPAEGLLSSELAEKGYLVEAGQEQRSYRNRYFDFVDNRDQDEVQLFFVPNYSCNFQCRYCYQDDYTNPLQSASEEVIDAFFAFVRKQFAGRKKYLTLFGGEPLLNSERQRHLVARLIDRSNEAGLSVCVVTNGYHLRDYIPVLSKGSIREIQVTLDGTQGIHDGRRSLKNGSPTFEKIVEGIDAALEVGFPINLRMVIDKRNVENLAELATFAIGKGWTSHPLFKTQIGRNYEL